MTFQPVIPLPGVAGWNFLQSTYDKQVQVFADSAQISNDRAYLEETLSNPISLDELISDRRLLRVTLTAFGLAGEETKGGLVRKVLEDSQDTDSTFLQRLNNPAYTDYAEVFGSSNGSISLSSTQIAEIANQFEVASFEVAVGEVDGDQRIGLSYQSNIDDLVGEGSSEIAILFRLLGSRPAQALLSTALNIPDSAQKLPIERQAEILKEALGRQIGVTDLNSLKDPENIDRLIRRYHAIRSAQSGPDITTPGAIALTLLTGVGANASQNLFLSRF